MKKIAQFLLISAGFAFSGAAIAETIAPGYNPDATACDYAGADQTCWEDAGSPSQPSTDFLLTLIFGANNYTLSEWDLLYKDEVDDTDGNGNVTKLGEEDGKFAGSYSTTFSNTEFDPQDADINWDGGSAITCPECYLWVKDGNQNPDLYVFDIGWWDGMTTLNLRNFWTGKGAISNVGIIGKGGMQVPEPGTLGLLGLGLIGFGMARRRRNAA